MSVELLAQDIRYIRSTSTKISDVEKVQRDMNTRVDQLEQVNDWQAIANTTLQDRVNDSEQYSGRANIEIVGIPTTPGEDIYCCLSSIAKVFQINFKKEDISLPHRLRVYSGKH